MIRLLFLILFLLLFLPLVLIPTKPQEAIQPLPVFSGQDSLRIMVYQYTVKYELDYEFVCRLIEAESGWDTKAVSCRGAKGLMQLMSCHGCKDRFNAEENVKYGTRHLAYLKAKYKDDRTVLWAWNCGERRMRGKIKPRETRKLIRKVMR